MDEPGQGRTDVGEDYEDDEISLRPYVETLWRYRQVIGAATLAVAVVFLFGLLALWLRTPVEQVSSVQFRLLFDGAAENRYPNGSPFSPAEIVGAPVVTEVFKVNELQRFGSYEDFRGALFIQQSSSESDVLASEYQSRLADTKLTPVDRARIEDEFRKRREALTDPAFSLSLRRSERFNALPKELAQKALTDILDTWARQADELKGALAYQVPMLSGNSLSRESLEKDDYLVAADRLRAQAVRLLHTIDRIEKLPGALTIRTAKDGASLADIRAGLEDAIRFDLEPLPGIIRAAGITKNARLSSLYASNMMFQLRLDRQETEARAKALQAALRDYVAQGSAGRGAEVRGGAPSRPGGLEGQMYIPLLSDSFLTRIQDMSVFAQKDEMEFRRKLTNQIIDETRQVATFDRQLQSYQDLVRALAGVGARAAGSPELVALVTARTQSSFSAIEKAVNQLSMLYHELSAQNLDPAARLYAKTGPFTQYTERALPTHSITLSFVLVMMLTLVLVPIGCLVHDGTRKKTA